MLKKQKKTMNWQLKNMINSMEIKNIKTKKFLKLLAILIGTIGNFRSQLLNIKSTLKY